MKLKTIMVKVDGPANQEQVGNFEQLFEQFCSDPQHRVTHEGVRMFVVPISSSASVYLVAMIPYAGDPAMTSAL